MVLKARMLYSIFEPANIFQKLLAIFITTARIIWHLCRRQHVIISTRVYSADPIYDLVYLKLLDPSGNTRICATLRWHWGLCTAAGGKEKVARVQAAVQGRGIAEIFKWQLRTKPIGGSDYRCSFGGGRLALFSSWLHSSSDSKLLISIECSALIFCPY